MARFRERIAAREAERKWTGRGIAEAIMIAFTAVTAVATWKGVDVAARQWEVAQEQSKMAHDQLALAQSQFAFAEKQAADSSKDAAASLDVSKKVATATADQAGAMRKMAEASARQASTSAQQAETARRQLAIAVAPNVDLEIHIAPYTRTSGFQAGGVIANRGNYMLTNAALAVAMGKFVGRPDETVWQRLYGDTMKISVARDVDHQVPLNAPPLPNDKEWEAFAAGKISVYVAMQLTFQDAAGTDVTIRRCVYVTEEYSGKPPYTCEGNY